MLKALLTASFILFSSMAHSNTMDDVHEAMQKGDFAIAFCQLKPLAESGDSAAQYNLGWMYHNGYGLRINDNLALEWWQRASEQGYTDASFSIAMLYNLGEGQISKNLPKAVDYYMLAADHQHEEAIIILRSMLTRDDEAIKGRKRELVNRYSHLLGPVLQVKANRLNIRSGASLDTSIVTRLEQGAKVIELRKQGKWSQIGIINSAAENQTIAWAYNLLLEPYQAPVVEQSSEEKNQNPVPARMQQTRMKQSRVKQTQTTPGSVSQNRHPAQPRSNTTAPNTTGPNTTQGREPYYNPGL